MKSVVRWTLLVATSVLVVGACDLRRRLAPSSSTGCDSLRQALVGTWRATDGTTGSGWRFPGEFSLSGGGLYTSGSTTLAWSPAYSPPDENCDSFILVDGNEQLVITYNIEYLSDDFLRIQNWNTRKLYYHEAGGGGGGSGGANPSDDMSLELVCERSEVWANGHENVRLQATLRHASLGPLSDVEIDFESSNPQAVAFTPIVGASTDENGIAVSYVTTTQVGAVNVRAHVHLDPEVEGSTAINGIRRRVAIVVQGIATALPSSPPDLEVLRDVLANAGFRRPTRGTPEPPSQWNDGLDNDGDMAIDDGGPMLLDYSYQGGAVNAITGMWSPYPYSGIDTGQSLITSTNRLQTMIDDYSAENPSTGLVVLGHSQGGFLTLQTLNAVVQAGTPSTVLKAIITLDGALGGVPSGFMTLVAQIANWNSWSAIGNPAPYELMAYWDTATQHSMQGTTASSIAGIRHDQLVTSAHALGVRTLTIGNSQDCIFNPAICFVGFGPDNSSTQIIDTQQSQYFMYQLGLQLNPVATHGLVLTDPSVHQRIVTFLGTIAP